MFHRFRKVFNEKLNKQFLKWSLVLTIVDRQPKQAATVYFSIENQCYLGTDLEVTSKFQIPNLFLVRIVPAKLLGDLGDSCTGSRRVEALTVFECLNPFWEKKKWKFAWLKIGTTKNDQEWSPYFQETLTNFQWLVVFQMFHKSTPSRSMLARKHKSLAYNLSECIPMYRLVNRLNQWESVVRLTDFGKVRNELRQSGVVIQKLVRYRCHFWTNVQLTKIHAMCAKHLEKKCLKFYYFKLYKFV